MQLRRGRPRATAGRASPDAASDRTRGSTTMLGAVHVTVPGRARRDRERPVPSGRTVAIARARAAVRLDLEPAVAASRHRQRRCALDRRPTPLAAPAPRAEIACGRGRCRFAPNRQDASAYRIIAAGSPARRETSTALRARTSILSSFTTGSAASGRRAVDEHTRRQNRSAAGGKSDLRWWRLRRRRQDRNRAVGVAGRRGAGRAGASSGFFQESSGIISPFASNQAMSKMPGAGSRRPCRKWRERNAVCSWRSAMSLRRKAAQLAALRRLGQAPVDQEVSLSWQ